MTKYKAFTEALTYINSSSFKLKEYLDDNRPTQSEKRIILGYALLRESKFDEIIESLNQITGAEDWVEAHKNLLLGITYNNKCEAQKGIPYLLKAITTFTELDDKTFAFSGHYNLFFCYTNLKRLKEMGEELDSMIKLENAQPHYPQVVLRSKFNFLVYSNRVSEATSCMKKLDSIFEDLHQNLKPNYLIDKFNFMNSLQKFEKAAQILTELKKYKAFYHSANFKFMKGLLDFVKDDKRLYLYESDFQNSPLLLFQMKTILYLDQNEKMKAQEVWGNLAKTNPEIYMDNFKYNGPPCLFSFCLEKVTRFKAGLNNLERIADRELMLHNFFSQGNISISKDELYELIWGTKADSKDCFIKLAQLIYRTNKRFGKSIKSKKGNYFSEKIIAA